MKTIGLIACASKKQLGSHPAAELYTSPLFRMSRAWVERHCPDGWFILSAKHHLLHPDDIVPCYDHTLKDLTRQQRAHWADTVSAQLQSLGSCNFIVFAGAAYCQALEGLEVERPLQGLGIGQQLRWLKNHLQAPDRLAR